ncbi:hypothetical protein SOVF_203240 [Spinacia oleracea]|nr:hypothetical protein SOVF_203240 [Spinacia oleracea]
MGTSSILREVRVPTKCDFPCYCKPNNTTIFPSMLL